MSDSMRVDEMIIKPIHHEGPALVLHGLSGGYDDGDVFRDVDLDASPGEAVRIEGDNAAGKSTLMRCVAGIKRPRTGRVSICGWDLSTAPVEAKRHLGYSAGGGPFAYLTGREHLRLAGRVHRLSRDNEAHLLGRFPDWATVHGIDVEVRRYSHGMRQQLSIMLSVLHDPCLLLLDEAVDGLDNDTLVQWASYLHERSRAGRSLLFVEHRDEVATLFPTTRAYRLAGFRHQNKPGAY